MQSGVIPRSSGLTQQIADQDSAWDGAHHFGQLNLSDDGRTLLRVINGACPQTAPPAVL